MARLFVQLMVAHAPFRTQEVKALTSFATFSALTTPSTVMRQPMLSLSPCATTLPMDAAVVIANSNDHGRRDPVSMLRVTIDVEIADVGDGPRWSEDLVPQLFGVEGFGVVDSGVGVREAFLRAEDAVQPRHSQSPSANDHQDEQRNPQPPQNSDDRRSRISATLSRSTLCLRCR